MYSRCLWLKCNLKSKRTGYMYLLTKIKLGSGVWCTKVPILQVVISFWMKLWPVAPFFSLTFGIGDHTKHWSMSFPYSSTRNDMLQCFVCSPIPKVSEKKGATGQSFIRKEITTCRIGTLDIKPLMHLLKISVFSLNNDLVRLTKIMNNLVREIKILSFKVIFQHLKLAESFQKKILWRIFD